MKMGIKPREGILHRLPCLMWRVRAMSEAQSKGTSSLASTGAMNVGGCHDPQHSGACWTYFPQPQTRHIDPRSILVEQCTMLDEATKVGMRSRHSHLCTITFSSQCVYIYLTSTGNFPSLEIN